MLMKRRKFADGGETTEMMPDGKPRFDKDTYARARRFVESGGEKEESKPAPKPARKAEAPKAEAPKAEAPKAVGRASDTSKRFPSEMPAPKGDTDKSVSERIKESRERARTSTTGTDTRSVNERIRGSKVDAEETPAKYGKIPVDPDGPKAPKSTGESTSGPSNIERLLAPTPGAVGAVSGLRGLMGRKGADVASSAERSLATRETPIKFLGRSEAKNITPRERLAGRQDPKLGSEPLKIGRNTDTPKPTAPRQVTNNKSDKPSDKSSDKPKQKNVVDDVLDILRGKNQYTPKKENLGRAEKSDRTRFNEDETGLDFNRGGKVKKYASGGMVSSVSRRADGIAQKGKTKCRIC